VYQNGVEVGEERRIDIVEEGFCALYGVNTRHQDVVVRGG
jgi:hypothetical protein